MYLAVLGDFDGPIMNYVNTAEPPTRYRHRLNTVETGSAQIERTESRSFPEEVAGLEHVLHGILCLCYKLPMDLRHDYLSTS